VSAYYNDNDPFVAAWLRTLIERGEIAPGEVDQRSITDVRIKDLAGFDQHHFFAGVGGWSAALRLAGWPDDRPCFTGSVPCQPLSVIGERRGHVDQRHLWPAFFRLITERAPAVVFGEQVAGADGREWLAGIRADLEHLGYAFGAADLPAACVGAPHKRQRLFWVADRNGPDSMGNAEGTRLSQRERDTRDPREMVGSSARQGLEQTGPTDFWDRFDIAYLSDGTQRRIEPGTFPLADGLPGRVGRLRAYGNALVPQVAALFVRAWVAS